MGKHQESDNIKQAFYKCLTKENTEKYQLFSKSNRVTLDNFTITTEMVGKFIKQLDATNSQEPELFTRNYS